MKNAEFGQPRVCVVRPDADCSTTRFVEALRVPVNRVMIVVSLNMAGSEPAARVQLKKPEHWPMLRILIDVTKGSTPEATVTCAAATERPFLSGCSAGYTRRPVLFLSASLELALFLGL